MNHSMSQNYGLVFVSCVALGYVLAVAPGLMAAEDDDAKTSTPAESAPAELSVAPLDHVVYPADRPKWLADAPKLDGETHHWVVVTPACDNPEDAADMIAIQARGAVESYVEQLSGATTEQMEFSVDDRWIDDVLVAKRYSGDFTEGDAPRFEEAVLLSFSPTVQEQIKARWKNFEVRQRLGALGLCVTGFLGMLFVGSGVLSVVGRRFQVNQPV